MRLISRQKLATCEQPGTLCDAARGSAVPTELKPCCGDSIQLCRTRAHAEATACISVVTPCMAAGTALAHDAWLGYAASLHFFSCTVCMPVTYF
jgi:hypothetical protein